MTTDYQFLNYIATISLTKKSRIDVWIFWLTFSCYLVPRMQSVISRKERWRSLGYATLAFQKKGYLLELQFCWSIRLLVWMSMMSYAPKFCFSSEGSPTRRVSIVSIRLELAIRKLRKEPGYLLLQRLVDGVEIKFPAPQTCWPNREN